MSPLDGLLVCGNLNVDRIFTVPFLPSEGQSTPVLSYREAFGGCGGNIAVAASRLGATTFLSTIVGTDLDASYRKRLEEARVDLSLMVVDEGLPSPYCIILSTPEGRQSYAFCEGAMARQGDLDVPFGTGVPPRFVHIATSDPSFAARTALSLSDRGSEVSIDPGQELFFRWDRRSLARVLPECKRVFANLNEWTTLGRIMGWKGERSDAGGWEVELFPEALDILDECIVTLGPHGSFLYDERGLTYSPPFPVERALDATGAGDAFRGAFYAALIRGLSLRTAIRFGDAMGSLTVSEMGHHKDIMTWEGLSKMVGP